MTTKKKLLLTSFFLLLSFALLLGTILIPKGTSVEKDNPNVNSAVERIAVALKSAKRVDSSISVEDTLNAITGESPSYNFDHEKLADQFVNDLTFEEIVVAQQIFVTVSEVLERDNPSFSVSPHVDVVKSVRVRGDNMQVPLSVFSDPGKTTVDLTVDVVYDSKTGEYLIDPLSLIYQVKARSLEN